MINVILFDLDGVLINSARDIREAINYSLSTLGFPVKTVEEVAPTYSMHVYDRFSLWIGDEENRLKAVELYKEHYLKVLSKQTELYDGVKEVVSELHSTKKLGIISNKHSAIVSEILRVHNLLEYFDIIIGGNTVTSHKPHPMGILMALEKCGFLPSEAMMIGDTNTDILAGKSAKTHTCGAAYGLGNVDLLKASAPDYLIDDIRDLIAVCKNA